MANFFVRQCSAVRRIRAALLLFRPVLAKCGLHIYFFFARYGLHFSYFGPFWQNSGCI